MTFMNVGGMQQHEGSRCAAGCRRKKKVLPPSFPANAEVRPADGRRDGLASRSGLHVGLLRQKSSSDFAFSWRRNAGRVEVEDDARCTIAGGF